MGHRKKQRAAEARWAAASTHRLASLWNRIMEARQVLQAAAWVLALIGSVRALRRRRAGIT